MSNGSNGLGASRWNLPEVTTTPAAKTNTPKKPAKAASASASTSAPASKSNVKSKQPKVYFAAAAAAAAPVSVPTQTPVSSPTPTSQKIVKTEGYNVDLAPAQALASSQTPKYSSASLSSSRWSQDTASTATSKGKQVSALKTPNQPSVKQSPRPGTPGIPKQGTSVDSAEGYGYQAPSPERYAITPAEDKASSSQPTTTPKASAEPPRLSLAAQVKHMKRLRQNAICAESPNLVCHPSSDTSWLQPEETSHSASEQQKWVETGTQGSSQGEKRQDSIPCSPRTQVEFPKDQKLGHDEARASNLPRESAPKPLATASSTGGESSSSSLQASTHSPLAGLIIAKQAQDQEISLLMSREQLEAALLAGAIHLESLREQNKLQDSKLRRQQQRQEELKLRQKLEVLNSQFNADLAAMWEAVDAGDAKDEDILALEGRFLEAKKDIEEIKRVCA